MSFVIKVREWQEDILTQQFDAASGKVPAQEEHAWILGEIFKGMASGLRVASHKEYLPSWNLAEDKASRGLVGNVLTYVWRRCQAEYLPELNFLVVNKRTLLPGAALRESWRARYGSLDGFEPFCRLRAGNAAWMLDKGGVRFDLTDMITAPDREA